MIRTTAKHCIAALAFLLLVGISPIFAQASAFTYQGKLAESGNLANTPYDFQFKLYDAATGGVQQGVTITLDDVPVTNGIFTVSLDFGLAVFTGANRFLEVSVRVGAESGAYTTLTPRQPVASTPYAVRSINAASASLAVNSQNLGGVPANQYVVTTDTRLSDDRNPLPSSPNYIQNTTSAQAAANFNISGNGTAGGTLAASIVNATTQYNIGINRVLSTAGISNLFVGINAGLNNTSSNNTFVGAGAGITNTSGGNNTFVGRAAGINNTTGHSNAFLGSDAGAANTTGLRNSFFGLSAGGSNTTGTDNSFFGASAGGGATGSFNSYFGAATGFATTGSNNSLFGYFAGRNSTTAHDNAYFGYQAGNHTITGSDNSFFGSNAGLENRTGTNNAFFGSGAGQANMTGDSNAFFGRNAGAANAASDGNAMFGNAAGQSSTGAANSFFGNTSGLLTTTGSSNAFFGANAGFTNMTGSNNTLIGANANVQTSGLSFATAIGADAVVTAANSVVLGRAADTVQVPGKLVVTTLGSAGATALCQNGSKQISTCSSSIRYKTNINAFNLGMQLINRMRPVTFNWKATNEPDLGFVAEEVAAAEPLLTTRNAKGEVEGVKYDRVAVALVNAVKEQQAIIKDQQQQLATLRQELEALKRLIHPAPAATRASARRK